MGQLFQEAASNTTPSIVSDAVGATSSLTVTANGQTCTAAVTNMDGVLATISTAGFTGTLSVNFELSDDGGTTWFATIAQRMDINASLAGVGVGNNALQPYLIDAPGATHVRMRVSAFTSVGTAPTLRLTPSSAPMAPQTIGAMMQVGNTALDLRNTSGDGIAQSFNALSVVAWGVGWNGATWDRLRTPTVFKANAANGTGNTTIWTPVSGKKFRLMRFILLVSGNASTAAAGTTVGLRDSGSNIVDFDVATPVAAANGAIPLFSSGWIDLGNGYLSSAANNVLQLNLGAALTTGFARIWAIGTEE